MPYPMYERPLVYVAGPYTRPDPVANTREAIITATRLTESGLVTAFVPHLTMLMHLVAPQDLDYWYEYDLSVLARADACYRMPGESTGADREVTYAEKVSVPIFTSEDDVLAWAVAP